MAGALVRCRPFGVNAAMKPAGLASAKLGGLEVNLPVTVAECCANGILNGDPRLSSEAAGKLFADHVVAETCRLVEHVKTQRFSA